MKISVESIRFTKWLKGVYAVMEFADFESEILKKFEDESESLDIQGLYVNYYL